jgi:hypothetical protein
MNRLSSILSWASLGLFLFGCFWSVANFTASRAAWWNSAFAMLAIFGTGAALAAATRPFQSIYRGTVLVLNLLVAGLWLLIIF